METTVEEIMTGKVSIDLVLKENKEKIQSITTQLEEIVRKGYFDILSNTETLVNLSGDEVENPRLVIPELPPLPQRPEVKEEKLIEDFVWDLINKHEFLRAAEIITNDSNPALQRIKFLLKDPYFYSIYSLPEQSKQRLKCFCILSDDSENLLERLLEFVCQQLIIQLAKSEEMDRHLNETSELLEVIVSTDYFFNEYLSTAQVNTISEYVSSFIEKHKGSLQSQLYALITSKTEVSDLRAFISDFTPKYGMTNVWQLCSDFWLEHAGKIIPKLLVMNPENTLKATLDKYSAQCSGVVMLLESLPSHLSGFVENITDQLPRVLFSGVDEDTNPLLVLGFIRSFNTLKIFRCFTRTDLAEAEAKYLEKSLQKLKDRSILAVCREIKSVCGEIKLELPELDVRIADSQRALGSIIGKQPNCEEFNETVLPRSKNPVEKLALPPRFFPHLIIN